MVKACVRGESKLALNYLRVFFGDLSWLSHDTVLSVDTFEDLKFLGHFFDKSTAFHYQILYYYYYKFIN